MTITRRQLLRGGTVLAAASALPLSSAFTGMAIGGGEPYIGQIILFGGNFAPAGWAFCDGALLPISEHDALFTLIGTTYGGDGQETFALPNLQSRVPVHMGNGLILGEMGGTESETLTQSQLPAHSHVPLASTSGNQAGPTNGVWAGGGSQNAFSAAAPNGAMAPNAIAAAGGSQPHENMHPFLVMTYCIALFGIWPSTT